MLSRRFDCPKGLNSTMELSFDLPTFNDVDNEYARCLQQGVQGVMPPNTELWGQRTAYIADPDGNLIELSSFNTSVKEEPKKRHIRWKKSVKNMVMPICLGKRKQMNISYAYTMKVKQSRSLLKYSNAIMEEYDPD